MNEVQGYELFDYFKERGVFFGFICDAHSSPYHCYASDLKGTDYEWSAWMDDDELADLCQEAEDSAKADYNAKCLPPSVASEPNCFVVDSTNHGPGGYCVVTCNGTCTKPDRDPILFAF